MTDDAPRTDTEGPATPGWRAGALRALGAIAVVVAPIAVALWATAIGRATPVRAMAWVAAAYLVAYPVYRAARRRVTRDYTVHNVAWVMALLVALLAISPAIFPWDGSQGVRMRTGLAQSRVRTLAHAIEAYRTHTGQLPPDLAALTAPVTNARGESAGPFVEAIPAVPAGWTPYRYERTPDGRFRVETSGDGTIARSPS